MKISRYQWALVSVFFATLIWSLINPRDYTTWLLEAFPVFLTVGMLVFFRTKFRWTDLSYTLVLVATVIIAVGGHYTYAKVPLGLWMQDVFGFTRNHYDRIGHFFQGVCPAIFARELLIRTAQLRRGLWLSTLCMSMVMMVSSVYEIIEWFVALYWGERSSLFLGLQGDVWDTQADMLMAFIGGVLGLLVLSKLHDKQLKKLDL